MNALAECLDSPAELPTPKTTWEKLTLQPVRVLLIEDDQDARDTLSLTLQWMGYSVFTAQDGETGLRMAEREHPDVFISDIRMPGMDGYTLVTRIRMNPELEPIPGIALTGFGMKSDILRALAAGFDAYMVKPADIESLSALVQRLAANGRHRENPLQ